MDDSEVIKLLAKHAALSHAIQTGVAYEMQDPQRSSATEPKHLRTGINIALCDHSSLVRLLIAKGVISEEEYLTAIVGGLEEEVRAYEGRLSEKWGGKTEIHLA